MKASNWSVRPSRLPYIACRGSFTCGLTRSHKSVRSVLTPSSTAACSNISATRSGRELDLELAEADVAAEVVRASRQ